MTATVSMTDDSPSLKFTLLVPTKNEIAGLKLIMPRVPRELFQQILIVDKDSTDGSCEYALEQGYELHRQTRPGVRMAYVESAPKVTGDVVITFSPDGNSVPEVLPDLVRKMREGYDMVIVSRYLPPAKSHDDTRMTAFGNRVFTGLINLLFGGSYTDAMVMFRAYRRGVPAEMGLTRIHSDPYERILGSYISWEPQLSARCAQRKLRVAEIPGDEPPRVPESSSGAEFLLPVSRIYHYKAAVACFLVLLWDFIVGERQRTGEHREN